MGRDALKLLRFDDGGRARLGLARGNEVIPLDALASRYPTMLSLIAGGDEALQAIREAVNGTDTAVEPGGLRLLAPIERPGKFLAIGMNYKKHLAEAQKLGIAATTHQYWFNKQTSCIAGPFDDIKPGATQQLDYEAELAVVIGNPPVFLQAGDVVRCEVDGIGFIENKVAG